VTVPKLKRFKKSANGQGNIYKRIVTRPNGSTYERWEAKLSLGYDNEGKRKRETIYGRSQDEVLKKLDSLKQQVSSGLYVDDKRTLAQYLADWIKHKALEVKPTSIEHYQHHITNSINPDLGSVQLRKLSPAQLRTWIADLSKRVSPNAANKARAVLRNALRQALKDGLIVCNPLEAVAPLKVEDKHKDLEWSVSEVVMFLNTARTQIHYAAFYLALNTGMRYGEV
jgi:integrase